MDKDYIEVKIPILDSVDEMKVAKTFNQEQLWFVCAIAKAFEKSEQQCKKQKEVIDKSREYLTSYSSIHTIQFGTENDSLNDIELNKTLDEKTLNEMTNRYLKVHDKLLDILKEVSDE